MSEVDIAIEKLEKYRVSTGLYKGQRLTLKLRQAYFNYLGRTWTVVLWVESPIDVKKAHEKSFWRYESALKHYEELKQKYGLEEKRQ